jgi:hypothetical protein
MLDVYDLPDDQLPWSADTYSDTLDVVEGPTPVTIKLYRHDGDTVVESGATATVQQYRYGSSDPNIWPRQVVWILEGDTKTTIAAIAFPEFPEDSFPEPADPINLSLTGLDPIDILNDIRFFE